MKTRDYPVELLRLKRLYARMEANHPERGYVTELVDRAEAGYKGETAVDNYLLGLRLPCAATVLRNVRLRIHEDYIAQFDTVLATERGIWIIEAKMIRGTLRLLENPRRMERVNESGGVLTMDCPILQLENQKAGLGDWLKEQGLAMPIGGVVAFATRNTWIGLPEEAPIVSVKELKIRLKGLVKNSPPPDERYSPFEEVIKRIRTEELGPDMRPFEEMGIRSGPLKEGLICENCFSKLKRVSERKYECPTCEALAEGDAVGRALRDYFLLREPRITNRDFCKLLGFRWHSTGRRYLMRYDLDRDGRVYHFDPRRHLEGTELRRVDATEGLGHSGTRKGHSMSEREHSQLGKGHSPKE